MSKQSASVRDQAVGIDARQSKALERLLEGDTVIEAAAASGVDRSTIHRWLRSDYPFKAAYNGARLALQDALDARLLGLAESATTTVASAIQRGDVPASIAVLRGLGLLNGRRPSAGPDDPDDLRKDEELAARERRSDRLMKDMTLV